MKKYIYYSIIFICLSFVYQTVNGQKTVNPFIVKNKNHSQINAVNPSSLNQGVIGTSIPSNRTITGVIQQNPKTIPFVFPGNLNQELFSEVSYAKNGLINFAEYQEGNGISIDFRSEENTIEACYAYLNNLKKAMLINEPSSEFEKLTIETDIYGGTHIKMQQYHNGVKVYGGQIILHAKNDLINRFNGTYYPSPNIKDVNPVINEIQASDKALEDVKSVTTFKPLTNPEKEILDYTEPVVELIIYHPDRKLNNEVLAYHITVRPNFLDRYEYFIDAFSGEVIDFYNNTCTDGPHTAQAVDLNGISRTINTYLVGNKYYMMDGSKSMFNASQSELPDNPVGGIMTINANNSNSNDLSLFHITTTDNIWSDPTAVSAHYNADVTFNYYKNTHNRTSINGQGGTIISIINIADEDGSGMDNAFWNGQAMFYGNGNQLFLPLAGGLDVGAHEMTHGVVQNTANLEYKNESGAINEAMADISGAMVDRDDWQLGEDIIPGNSQYYPNGALRDMQNPHNGGSSFNDPSYQPMHTNEQYTGTSDNGGVHINSGIINHAYYLLSEAISKNKAEQIFYLALSQYMTKSSQFIDCRLAFEQAAKDIYGNGTAEYNAVVNAFFSVGIGNEGGGGDGSDPPGEIPVNPGQDYIVSVDVNENDPNTLYISNTQGGDFVPISQTSVKRKLSITDDGAVAVFVDESDRMMAIDMSSFQEEQLSMDEIWDNVAVSKDGRRIAAITTEIDSAIWVYNFSTTEWAKYHLYNPTFTEGVITHNVLYADAIEWDYTGQYLLYDAYNELENSQGQDIDYWDMGFIKVWSNASDNWGDGEIFKLFSSLPEGVSIGNPTLAKNSPFIVAFDYFDSSNDETFILGANLETGEVAEIFQNSILGFPNYSKLDDKIVFNALNTQSVEVVGQIGLQQDKISPVGDPSILIDVAKFPVWYSTGSRDLDDINETESNSFFTNIYPNPFSNEINVVIDAPQQAEYTLAVFDLFGKMVKEVNGKTNGQLQKETIPLSELVEGTYFVRLIVNDKVSSRKIVKIN